MAQTRSNILQLHSDNEAVEIPVQPVTSVDPILLGFTSAVGGAGVTSVAIQTAFHLSRQNNPNGQMNKTCLLSLDFENSALAQYLDMESSIGVRDFTRAPAEIDTQLAESWMTHTPYGFDVLVLPSVINGNNQVNPETVLSFLDCVCDLYEIIILDIPRLWTNWTHAAFGTADRIAMITELSVPHLHLTRERSRDIMRQVSELKQVDYIINKYERRSFRNGIKVSDAEKALATPFLHTICTSADKIRDALNRGEPLGSIHQDSRMAREINDMAEEWVSAVRAKRERESGRLATNI